MPNAPQFPRLFARTLGILLALAACLTAQEITVQGGASFDVTISDGDTSPRSTDSTLFGSIDVSGGTISKTFRIRNTAANDGNPFTGNLIISSITVSNSTNFAITSPPIVSLSEGQFGNLTIAFNPSTTGTKNATVTIRNNDSNEDPYTFAIRGVATGMPEIAVSYPNFLGDGTPISDGDLTPSTSEGTDFGTVDALGPDTVRTFRVKNSGTASLICSISDDSGDWFASGLSSAVSPGNFDDFTITFNPQSSGLKTATFTITNNDSNENPYTFRVSGVARAPEIQVQGGASLNVNIADGDTTPSTTDRTDFGSRDIGVGPLDRTFRIRNTQASDGIIGTGDLVVSAIQSTSSHFQILNAPLLPIPEGGFADFTIRFDPTSTGTKNSTIRITNNDPDGGEGLFTFNVTGVGTASSEIAVYGFPGVTDGTLISDGDSFPSSADGTHFGDVDALGGAISHTFRVRNSGSATLTLGFSDDSSLFSFSSTVSSIPPGGFDDFNINFNPSVSGTSTATITIDTNDPDGGEDPYTFSVRGTGRAPEIAVRGGASFASTILDGDTTPNTFDGTDFGSADVLGEVVDTTFRIRNDEISAIATDLVISSLTENSSQFSILNFPVLPIPEGGFADFTVRFDPTVVGTHSAVVTIGNNDPDGGEDPYTFRVTAEGTGTPEIEVYGLPLPLLNDGFEIANGDSSPDAVDGTDFGTLDLLGPLVERNNVFRLKNVGTAPLTVGVTGDSDAFRVEGVAGTVFANNIDDFNIIFAPAETGTFTATITITSDDDDENPYTFTVQGKAVAPEITVLGGTGQNILISSGDMTPRTLDGTDFGEVAIGDSIDVPFHIRNLSPTDGNPLTNNLNIVSVTIDNPQFTVPPPPVLPISIPEGSPGATFTFRFAPTAVGPQSATVTIVHNDPDGDETPYTFALAGSGLAVPEIEVYGRPLPPFNDGFEIANGNTTPSAFNGTDFGTLDLLGPLQELNNVFRLKNVGTATLNVLVTDSSGAFRVEGVAGTVGPNNIDDFNIIFAPTETGVFTARINIRSNDDDEDPYIFDVRGEAVAPEIDVLGGTRQNILVRSGDSVPSTTDGTDFGKVSIGDGAESSFRIRNRSPSDGNPLTNNLNIISITIDDPQFTVLPSPLLPISIPEGSPGAVFTFRFAPTAVGPQSATVTIVHNDPDDGESPFTFTLGGSGLAVPEIEVYGLPLPPLNDGFEIANGDSSPDAADGTNFGKLDLLGPLQELNNVFRLKNVGTAPLTVSVSDDSSAFRIEGVAGTVGADNIDDFNIIFAPTETGVFTATVTITSNDADENPYTFTVQGEAEAPEITVLGGTGQNVLIASGNDTPRAVDGTEFGEVIVGENAESSFRIRNLSPSDGNPLTNNLNILSITIDDPQFTVLPSPLLPISIPEGSPGATFTFRFTPTADGQQDATVTIVHNDPDDDESPYTFALAGSGLAVPEIEVYGLPLPPLNDGFEIANGDASPDPADGTDFGILDLLGPLPELNNVFRLKNSGAAPLTVSVADDSAAFRIEGVAGTVGADNIDDFNIIFAPTETGVFNATITITSDDADENPYTFTVRGEAVAPEIAVLGGPSFDQEVLAGDVFPRPEDGTDFGGVDVDGSFQDKVFRIANFSPSDGNPVTNNLNIVSITTDDPQFLVLAPPILPIVIPEDGSADFTFRFLPTALGPQDATVTIVHNDPDGNETPFTFALEGIGTGEPDIQVFGLPTPITDGVEIEDGDATPSFEDGTNFGTVAFLPAPTTARVFRIRNTGTAPLDYAAVASPFSAPPEAPPGSGAWLVTSGAGGSIPAGQSVDIPVQFIANQTLASGFYTGQLRITSTDPEESPYTFLMGVELRAPEITVLAGPVNLTSGEPAGELAMTDFGDVDIDAGPQFLTIRILNTETEDGNPLTDQTLFLIDSTVSNDTPPGSGGGFAPLLPFPSSLVPPIPVVAGAFLDFTIGFDPDVVGPYTGTIAIFHNDPDGAEGPFFINLRGNGTVPAPEIALFGQPDGLPEREIENGDNTPNNLENTNFGVVQIAAGEVRRTFRLENSGTLPLTVSASSNTPDFDIEGLLPSIAAGSSDLFEIVFDPAVPGIQTAVITIINNDADENPFSFAVRAEVEEPPTPGLEATTFDFTAEGGATVSFPSDPARTYRITASENGVTFTPIITGLAGTGAEIEVDLSPFIPTPGIPTRLLRVEEE